MSEYNNPRPLPTASASDPCTIVDNAISFDKVVNGNSTVTTYTGKQILSLSQAIDKFGFGVAPFTFTTGGTLESKNLLVSNDPIDGFLYKYVGSGSFPLTVTAGTDPTVGSDWQQFAATDHNLLSNRNAVGAHDAVYSRGYPTVATAVVGALDLDEGVKINWRGYHTESDGGSNWGIVRKGDTSTVTDDGGSIFISEAGVDGTWIEANLNGKKISVKKFGAKGDNASDNYNNIVSAKNFCALSFPYKRLHFPDGIYKTSGKLVFDNVGMVVSGDGDETSIINFTGAGDAVEFNNDNPNNGIYAFGGCIRDIGIKGTSDTLTLLKIKYVNHFKAKNINLLEANSTSGIGLHILGVVLGYFENITCSTNRQLMSSRPQNGIVVDRDPVSLSRATANLFVNPIIEGMTGDGIQLINSDQNMFIGGTSENNSGNGITIAAGSRMNTLSSVAFEHSSPTTFADIYDAGFSNKFINCYSSKLIYIDTSAQFSTVDGGFHQSIDDHGDFSTIRDLKYSFFSNGGTVNTSPSCSTRNLFNVELSAITFNVKPVQSITATGSPFTYTNWTGLDVEVVLSGGTVTQVVFDRGGPVVTLPNSGMFRLAPTDKLIISYSVAPDIVVIPFGANFM